MLKSQLANTFEIGCPPSAKLIEWTPERVHKYTTGDSDAWNWQNTSGYWILPSEMIFVCLFWSLKYTLYTFNWRGNNIFSLANMSPDLSTYLSQWERSLRESIGCPILLDFCYCLMTPFYSFINLSGSCSLFSPASVQEP